MEAFLELLDFILEGMDPKRRPTKQAMHEILFKQWKSSVKMKWDVEYYNRVTQDATEKTRKFRATNGFASAWRTT